MLMLVCYQCPLAIGSSGVFESTTAVLDALVCCGDACERLRFGQYLLVWSFCVLIRPVVMSSVTS